MSEVTVRNRKKKSIYKKPSKDDRFRAIVKAQMSLHNNMTQLQLSRRVGCAQPGVSRKMQHPDRLTLGELRKWAEVLEFSAEDIAKII